MNRRFKKIIILVFIFSMLAGMVGMSQPVLAAVGTFRTTDGVNLRNEPSTESNTLRVINRGSNVEVLDHNPAGWSRVQVGNSTGFIRSDFLRFPTDSGAATFRTTDGVNIRADASTDSAIISVVVAGTSVEVTEHDPAGWSRVRVGSHNGFIRSDFLTRGGSGAGATASAGASSSGSASVGTLRTNGIVNMRAGASTDTSIVRTLAAGVSVDVLEQQSNGWSRVRHNGTDGFIRSDFLGTGGRVVELIDWSTAKSIIPRNTSLRVTDVRTGISYNVRGWAFGNHMDFDTATQEDTNTKRSIRGGTWSWAARPVWITVGDRTFAAAVNGMPHAGSVTAGNGLSGHFCMHFRGSTSNGSTSSSYIRNMQSAITEAWEARPNQ